LILCDITGIDKILLLLIHAIQSKNNLFCASVQTVPPNLDVLSFFKEPHGKNWHRKLLRLCVLKKGVNIKTPLHRSQMWRCACWLGGLWWWMAFPFSGHAKHLVIWRQFLLTLILLLSGGRNCDCWWFSERCTSKLWNWDANDEWIIISHQLVTMGINLN